MTSTTSSTTADKQPVKTPPITICNSSSRLAYTGYAVAAAPARDRADKSLAIPSRVDNRLHHRCGRITDLSGNPINHESHSHD